MEDLFKQVVGVYMENFQRKGWSVTLVGLSFYNFNDVPAENLGRVTSYFSNSSNGYAIQGSPSHFATRKGCNKSDHAVKFLKRPSNIEEETFNSLPFDIQQELCDEEKKKMHTITHKKKKITDFFGGEECKAKHSYAHGRAG